MHKRQRFADLLHDLENSLQISLAEPPQKAVTNNDQLNAISILDEFSFLCFSDVLNLWSVNPREVETGLRNIDPDFLFVESAWNGNQGSWRYMVTSSSGPKPPLKHLLRLCHKLGIPTVFWNKEDPPHFHEFRDTAKLFDFVYTTEGSLVEEYKSYIGHQNVDVLQFAASPKIHNPRRVNRYKTGDIAFGGQYFQHKFPERKKQMDALFTAARKHDFAIFSRALGGAPEYQFPPEYEQYIKGSLPYPHMVEEYKRHKVFININSVVDSQTMCARRVFELSAAKTNVISIDNEAIRRVFGNDSVSLTTYDKHNIEKTFDQLLHDETFRLKRAQNAWRKVASAHLYRNRVEQIRKDLKLDTTPEQKPSLGIVFVPYEFGADSRINDTLHEQISMMGELADLKIYFATEPRREWLANLPQNIQINSVSDPGVLARRLQTNPDRLDYISVMKTNHDYGPYHLWDLYHSLRYFVSEKIVSKIGTGPTSHESETNASYVYSGGWLAEATAPDLHKLILREYQEENLIFNMNDSVYLTDGFSFAPGGATSSWGI